MITRKDYMARQELHHAYYMQFVNPTVTSIVISGVRPEKILTSTDPHFNDIPLATWDRLESLIKIYVSKNQLRKLGEIWSKSTNSCIAKAAAREWRVAQEAAAVNQ